MFMLANGSSHETIDSLTTDEAQGVWNTYRYGIVGNLGLMEAQWYSQLQHHVAHQTYCKVNSKNPKTYKTVPFKDFKDLYPGIYSNLTFLEPEITISTNGVKVDPGLMAMFHARHKEKEK